MPNPVLIAEDSPTQAEALKTLLETHGYEVSVATNGEEAIARLAGGRFELVISDVVMPGIDGYELCRRIKTELGLRDLPVVLLTSLSDPIDIVRGLECGADNFLTKPYGPEHLLERVAHVLRNRELRRLSRVAVAVTLNFLGRTFTITSDKEQILGLLVSTYEDAVRKNRELQQRERQLEAANAELDAFSHSVSHDLRAPLRSIDGFSGALLQDYGDRLDETGRGYLERVRGSCRQMAGLIDDLLKLSRVTRAELRRESVPLGAVVESIAAELQRTEPARRVQWVIMSDVTVQGDPRLLRVALDNLIGNAWKYTRKNPRSRIEFGTAESEGESAYYVRDDGVGFDMAYADKLFGAFQRLHTSAEFEGTGIGLATVQRIIHRHGGRIWADAAVGRGATFYFTL